MKKPDIVKRIARQSGVSPGEAADRMESAVRQILDELRRHRETPFPGLGTFTRDDAVPKPSGTRTGGRRD